MKEFKQHLIGRPLRNSEAASQRYGVLWGLPVLSSDAISSVAYATEEILLILVPVVGLAAYRPMLGAMGIIIALLLMLILCYRQVIDAYPQGGGAYSVARANLGGTAALVAASGLIIGYILTIAVSVSSGVAAIISAFPEIAAYRVLLVVLFIVLLTIGNLRGLRESSVIFGLPTYLFIIIMLVMIVVGVVKVAMGVDISAAQASGASTAAAQATGSLTMLLFLRAFSSGCSALTGVEAISNSVPNFSDPPQRKAKLTLSVLGLVVLVVFGGVCLLAMLCQVTPESDRTVVAQIAGDIFGATSAMFYLVQVATAIILLLAANTAYNGLPQLMSLLARDGYLPKRFADRGSRLVYSSGILFASVVAIILVVAFGGQTHLLIPLYAGGVFLSFTLAQSGMVAHWRKIHPRGWVHKAAINGIGAVITGIVCVVIIATRFTAGAWIALVAIAMAVGLMQGIAHHYRTVADNLAFDDGQKAKSLIMMPAPTTRVIIPAYVVNKPFIKTLNYARSLSDDVEVYHVKTSPSATRRFKSDYLRLELGIPLAIDKAPYRNVNDTLLAHIDLRISQLGDGETLTVVMPQLVTRWWQFGLHNQTTFFLEAALLDRRDVALVTIPYIIDPHLRRSYAPASGTQVPDAVAALPSDPPALSDPSGPSAPPAPSDPLAPHDGA